MSVIYRLVPSFLFYYCGQIIWVMLILCVFDEGSGSIYKNRKSFLIQFIPFMWVFSSFVVMFFKDVYDGFKKLK